MSVRVEKGQSEAWSLGVAVGPQVRPGSPQTLSLSLVFVPSVETRDLSYLLPPPPDPVSLILGLRQFLSHVVS